MVVRMKIRKDTFSVIFQQTTVWFQYVTHIFRKEKTESIPINSPIKTDTTRELPTT